MGEIPYGRLDALEAALGGRAAIQEAYAQGKALVGARVFHTDFSSDPFASGAMYREGPGGTVLSNGLAQADENFVYAWVRLGPSGVRWGEIRAKVVFGVVHPNFSLFMGRAASSSYALSGLLANGSLFLNVWAPGGGEANPTNADAVSVVVGEPYWLRVRAREQVLWTELWDTDPDALVNGSAPVAACVALRVRNMAVQSGDMGIAFNETGDVVKELTIWSFD